MTVTIVVYKSLIPIVGRILTHIMRGMRRIWKNFHQVIGQNPIKLVPNRYYSTTEVTECLHLYQFRSQVYETASCRRLRYGDVDRMFGDQPKPMSCRKYMIYWRLILKDDAQNIFYKKA